MPYASVFWPLIFFLRNLYPSFPCSVHVTEKDSVYGLTLFIPCINIHFGHSDPKWQSLTLGVDAPQRVLMIWYLMVWTAYKVAHDDRHLDYPTTVCQ